VCHGQGRHSTKTEAPPYLHSRFGLRRREAAVPGWRVGKHMTLLTVAIVELLDCPRALAHHQSPACWSSTPSFIDSFTPPRENFRPLLCPSNRGESTQELLFEQKVRINKLIKSVACQVVTNGGK
jgi:hypothetical protein